MLVMEKCVAVGHCLLVLCDAVFCAILSEKQSSIRAENFDQRKFLLLQSLNSKSTRTPQERKPAKNLH